MKGNLMPGLVSLPRVKLSSIIMSGEYLDANNTSLGYEISQLMDIRAAT